jgi:hypothetical protein
VPGVLGLVLIAVRRPTALALATPALVIAAGAALHEGAPLAAAPLWGAGLLAAGGLAERALTLAEGGELEADALVAWLAGVGTLAGGGLAAAALVLLAARGDTRAGAAGLAAGALLAVLPALLARRRPSPPGR